MRIFIFIGLIALAQSIPQGYSEGGQEEVDLGNVNIGDIFGTSEKQTDGGYGTGGATGKLEDDSVNVLVEVVKDSSDNYTPDDYVEPTSNDLNDYATSAKNTDFPYCANYTATQGYMCVPYYQCHNGSIITDGAGLIDIRNGFGVLNPEESKCPGFLDVCCKDPDFVRPPPPKIKYAPRCGRRNTNGLGVRIQKGTKNTTDLGERIQGFNDYESQFGEWPHMCAVLHEKPVETQQSGYSGEDEPETVNLYQCGGSLIAPGVILTAGHCVDKFRGIAGELKVRCGEWDTQNTTEPYPHQDRKVSSLKVHPLFRPDNLINDYALLFLAEDFVLASHLDTVCLPNPDEVFDGETCFATGWGKDQFGSAGEYQVVLKEIDLPVVNNTYCQNSLRTSRLGPKFKLDDSFICAGDGTGKDTCKGDGGSPLVCLSNTLSGYNNANTYVQAGIVAWGVGCGQYPGVYASVSKAMCWVDYVMSCYSGVYANQVASINGFSSQICGPYMNSLNAQIGRLPPAIANQFAGEYSQCNVAWPTPVISENQRDGYTGDGNADQTADGSYTDDSNNQGNGDLVKGDSYNEPSADQVGEKVPETGY